MRVQGAGDRGVWEGEEEEGTRLGGRSARQVCAACAKVRQVRDEIGRRKKSNKSRLKRGEATV